MATERTTAQTRRIPLAKILAALSLLLSLLLLGGCKMAKIKDAELADQAGKYAEAADIYNRLYRNTPRREPERKAYLAFKAAENYRKTRNHTRALTLYAVARNYKLPDSIVLLRLGECHMSVGKLKEATKYYESFLACDPNNPSALNGLESTKKEVLLKGNPFKYKVQQERKLNSARSDFGGFFTPDGSTLYFTSSRNRNPEIPENLVTGEKNNELYFIRKDAKERWSSPDSVPGGINNGGDIGTPAITPDGNTLFYSYVENNDEVDRTVKIYRATKSGEGGWSEGKIAEIWSDTLRMAAHPTISADGKMLYFVSEGGLGGKDIYSIGIELIGAGVPTNLGPVINTPSDEMFPTMVGDSTLFFASDGKPGLGGLDLYVARKDSIGTWQVSHLGAPINSSGDDYGMIFNPVPPKELSTQGYFCSTRSDRRGFPHFFAFSQEAILTTLEGFVSDRDGNPIEGAVVRIVNEWNPADELKVTTRVDGYYSLDLSGRTKYLLLAGHPDYLNQYASFRTDSAAESAVYAIDFYLASRRYPEVFQDIFYDFDRAELRPESQKDLDEMVKILKENPDITVEISSHADRKGSDAYNIELSGQRATSVVNYLTAAGIAPERLISQGYGKTKPRTVNDKLKKQYPFLATATTLDEAFLLNGLTKEEISICDQLNRRTEFTVIE